MKKKIIFVLCLFSMGALKNVNALGAYMSVSNGTVVTGQSVRATLTIQDFTTAKIEITSAGNTSGCYYNDIIQSDSGENITRSVSVTCQTTSSGTMSFNYSVEALNKDYTSQVFSGSKIVYITPPREKDTNNYLKSLGVTGYDLTPEFSKETMEYSVKVPSTVNSVSLTAELESGYATLNGTGDFEVNEGLNRFEVKVISETGVERVYTVKVEVEDDNPIIITINDNNYTIMKNAKTLEIPATYEPLTIKINEFEIPAFYSEVSGYTLVGVKDSKGTSHFAIYNEKEKEYKLYNENKSKQLLLYLKPIEEEKEGFVKKNIVIQGNSYEALVSEVDSQIVLVNAMNILDGTSNYYIYNIKDETYLKYNDSITENLKEQLKKYETVILVFAGVILFLILLLFILLCFRPKRKKKEKENEKTIKVEKITPSKKEEEKQGENVVETKKERKKRLKEEKKKKKEEKSLKKDENVSKEKEIKKLTKKEEPKEEPLKEEKKDKEKKVTKTTKEEALQKVSNAAKIIEEYEKTIQINKKDLEKKKKEMEAEETMYDLFAEERKKKKK